MSENGEKPPRPTVYWVCGPRPGSMLSRHEDARRALRWSLLYCGPDHAGLLSANMPRARTEARELPLPAERCGRPSSGLSTLSPLPARTCPGPGGLAGHGEYGLAGPQSDRG